MSNDQLLVSYNNDQKIKDLYVNRMKSHIQQDQLKQGETGSKGCLTWCTLNHYDHEQFSKELGVDLWIPKMLDKIFEGMQSDKSEKFSLDILEAIHKGIRKKDTDMIRTKILYFILTEILPKKYQTEKQTTIIISKFEETIKGVTFTHQAWCAAAAAAATAYADAATVADAVDATVAAADASSSIIAAATATAATASYAAAAAAASSAADVASYAADRQLLFEKIGIKLVELFQDCKI